MLSMRLSQISASGCGVGIPVETFLWVEKHIHFIVNCIKTLDKKSTLNQRLFYYHKMKNMEKRLTILLVFHVLKICNTKLPRPWRTTICDYNFIDVDQSDHVMRGCSQDGMICVPLHYSEIGCANIGSLNRNTTVRLIGLWLDFSLKWNHWIGEELHQGKNLWLYLRGSNGLLWRGKCGSSCSQVWLWYLWILSIQEKRSPTDMWKKNWQWGY